MSIAAAMVSAASSARAMRRGVSQSAARSSKVRNHRFGAQAR
jgi:hypothetical protein